MNTSKKILILLILMATFTPFGVWAQTQATVSKVVNSYKGPKDLSESVVIKKSTEKNSLNVLLQASLINVGLNPGEPDGVIGPKTVQAVRDLQTNFGLTPDGVFGPKTAEALRIFSDRFPRQKLSDVKKKLPQDFDAFKLSLKNSKEELVIPKNSYLSDFVRTNNMELPKTPKGVLTYVLSKNQPELSTFSNSNSQVMNLLANISKKPTLDTSRKSSNSSIVSGISAGTTASNNLNLNFSDGSLVANSSYTCVKTSQNTENCTLGSLNSNQTQNNYYCRGQNCEVLGLANLQRESIEAYKAPSDFTRGIDFSKQTAWGEPVVFDKNSGKPTIYLRDHGEDPLNGQRNVSIVFVDIALDN